MLPGLILQLVCSKLAGKTIMGENGEENWVLQQGVPSANASTVMASALYHLGLNPGFATL